MTDSFSEYVDLVSTASKDTYPDNNNASFTNVLPIPLSLPPDCYVSLEEIGYTNSFYNVEKSRSNVAILDVNHMYPPRPEHYHHNFPVWGRYVNVTLDTGYYDAPEKLISMLNQRVRTCGVTEVSKRDIFRFDPLNKKVYYDMTGMQATVQIRGPLIHLMGIEIEKKYHDAEEFVALGMAKEGPTFVYTHKPEKKGEEGRKETRYWTNPENTFTSAGMDGVMEFPLQLAPHSAMVVYSDVVSSQVSPEKNISC